MNCNRFTAFPNKTRELFVWVGFSVKAHFLSNQDKLYKVHPQGYASAPLLNARSFPEVLKGLVWLIHLPNTAPAKGGKGPPLEVIRKVVGLLTGAASADHYGRADGPQGQVTLWPAQAKGSQQFSRSSLQLSGMPRA